MKPLENGRFPGRRRGRSEKSNEMVRRVLGLNVLQTTVQLRSSHLCMFSASLNGDGKVFEAQG
jgi:hypothetical protein